MNQLLCLQQPSVSEHRYCILLNGLFKVTSRSHNEFIKTNHLGGSLSVIIATDLYLKMKTINNIEVLRLKR